MDGQSGSTTRRILLEMTPASHFSGRAFCWILPSARQRSRRAAAAERLRQRRRTCTTPSRRRCWASPSMRTLPKVWWSNPAAAVASLAELEALAATALAEMRTLLLELRPTELTRGGLAPSAGPDCGSPAPPAAAGSPTLRRSGPSLPPEDAGGLLPGGARSTEQRRPSRCGHLGAGGATRRRRRCDT